SDDRTAITVSDENTASRLHSDNSPRGGYIRLERCLRLLHDADGVAVLAEDVVDAFPARAICPRAVNEHHVLHGWHESGTRGVEQQPEQHGETRARDEPLHDAVPAAIPVSPHDCSSSHWRDRRRMPIPWLPRSRGNARGVPAENRPNCL